MDARFVTIVGIDHYYGKKPFAVGDFVLLVKEPDNEHDAEAVRVLVPRLGTVGYVANAPSTVARGTQSAGRVHDAFDEACFARILFITRGEVIAVLEPGIVETADVVRIAHDDLPEPRGVGPDGAREVRGFRLRSGSGCPGDGPRNPFRTASALPGA